MRTTMLTIVLLSTFAVLPALAANFSCRPAAGGAAFPVAQILDVTAAAVAAAGYEQCDKVYHIAGQGYELGGCNRRSASPWSPSQGGSPIGYRHRRLRLICE